MTATKVMLASLWLKYCGLMMAVFTVWYLTVDDVWLPITTAISNTVIATQYSSMNIHLEQLEHEQWTLATNMFRASKSWPNNSYKPALRVDGVTQIPTGKLKSFTLGLPLLWLLILIMSTQKITQLIYTTMLLQGLIVVAVVVLFNYKITNTLSTEPLLRILSSSGYIQLPPQPPAWLPLLLKPLSDVLFMAVIMIAPTTLAFNFCRPWWRAQLLGLYLSANSSQSHDMPSSNLWNADDDFAD